MQGGGGVPAPLLVPAKSYGYTLYLSQQNSDGLWVNVRERDPWRLSQTGRELECKVKSPSQHSDLRPYAQRHNLPPEQ
jgi:hypothetical protein